MYVSFIRDKTKKYVCDRCNKQFNWNKDCWSYGKTEYKLKNQNPLVFCSTNCKEIFVLKKKESKD